MAVWARVNRRINIPQLLSESEKRGVIFQPGQLFTFGHRPTPHIRLGYGCLTEPEMRQALSRLRDAASAVL